MAWNIICLKWHFVIYDEFGHPFLPDHILFYRKVRLKGHSEHSTAKSVLIHHSTWRRTKMRVKDTLVQFSWHVTISEWMRWRRMHGVRRKKNFSEFNLYWFISFQNKWNLLGVLFWLDKEFFFCIVLLFLST